MRRLAGIEGQSRLSDTLRICHGSGGRPRAAMAAPARQAALALVTSVVATRTLAPNIYGDR
ncbi:hypothetical protein GCM10017556_23950 [Micromonospora sagamiensis]|nr:hypothetical protein GCM10017556_23950 [Micromonospora sagamiensis]